MRLNFDAAAAGIADGGQPRDEAPAQPGTTLDALYRTHAGRLLRRFVRRAGVQHAEDLVQETFVRLASAQAERGVAPASPERYLSRVATNLMIDETKSARERTAHLAIPHEDAELVAPDQLATLEARDMLNRVESALLDLKPLTREIFIANATVPGGRKSGGWSSTVGDIGHARAARRTGGRACPMIPTLPDDSSAPAARLKLYVAGGTPGAQRALESRNRLIEALGGSVGIEIIDIIASPEEAERAGILATPTLSDESHIPPRRLVGDIGNIAQVLEYFGYRKRSEEQ